MSDTFAAETELHPALIEAPREFNQWSRARMLIEQQESTPTEPL
jgi:hypothetical protein